MAITRLTQSTLQQAFPKYPSVWDGVSAVSSIDAISGVTLSSGQSKIEFNNIPQTYSHLQIRFIARNTSNSGGGAEENIRMILNGDVAANYSSHAIIANGSSVSAWAFDSDNDNDILLSYGMIPMSTAPSNVFASAVVDILDYSNTNKNKTTRGIGGANKNGTTTSYINFFSGNWRSTSGINSIQLFAQAGSFAANSTFTLYGIR